MRDIEEILETLPWVVRARKLIQQTRRNPELKPLARVAYRQMLKLNKPVIKAYADIQQCPLIKDQFKGQTTLKKSNPQ